MSPLDAPDNFFSTSSSLRSSVGSRSRLYGADLEGSFFPPLSGLPTWNLQKLPDLLRTGPSALEVRSVNDVWSVERGVKGR